MRRIESHCSRGTDARGCTRHRHACRAGERSDRLIQRCGNQRIDQYTGCTAQRRHSGHSRPQSGNSIAAEDGVLVAACGQCAKRQRHYPRSASGTTLNDLHAHPLALRFKKEMAVLEYPCTCPCVLCNCVCVNCEVRTIECLYVNALCTVAHIEIHSCVRMRALLPRIEQ